MKLTDTQLVLLSAASQRSDRGVILPPNLKGAIARNVVGKLLTTGLIEETPRDGELVEWRRDEDDVPIALIITAAGLRSIGIEPELPPSVELAPMAKTAGSGDRTAAPSQDTATGKQPRAGSKTEQLIALLQTAEGATIDEIVKALGWLPHTTRAALTGLRKRGYTIERHRPDDGPTTYRIVANEASKASDGGAPKAAKA